MKITKEFTNMSHGQPYVYILKLVHKTTNEELYYVGQSKLNLRENKSYVKGTWYYGFSRLQNHVKIDGSISENQLGVDSHLNESGLNPKDFVCATAELYESNNPKTDEFETVEQLRAFGYNVINHPQTIHPKRIVTRPGFTCDCCLKVIPPGTKQAARKSIVVYGQFYKLPDGIKICVACHNQTVYSKSFGSDKKTRMNARNNLEVQKWLLNAAGIKYDLIDDRIYPRLVITSEAISQ